MEKKISELTNEEILRKQLELLAEQSEKASTLNDLCMITHEMCNVYQLLDAFDIKEIMQKLDYMRDAIITGKKNEYVSD